MLDTPSYRHLYLTPPPLSTHNSAYAYWCTDGRQLGPDFVMVVTGELPTVASGLYDQPIPAANAVCGFVCFEGMDGGVVAN